MAGVYDRLGEHRKALTYYSLALPVHRELENRESVANALSGQGSDFESIGEYQSALDAYFQELPIRKDVGDRKAEGGALCNIGLVYSDLGQYEKALECYLRAVPILREVGADEYEANTFGNIGGVYAHVGAYGKALDYFTKDLAAKRRIGDRTGEGSCLNNIGVVRLDMGQYRESFMSCSRALAIQREIGDRDGMGAALNTMGIAYQHLGEYPHALDVFRSSLSIKRESSDRAGESGCLCNIGGVYAHLHRYQMALQYLSRALTIEGQIGNREFEANTLEGIADTYREIGKKHVAIAFSKEGINVVQSMRADIKGLHIDTQRSFRDTVADRYRTLADWLAEDGRLAEAQQVLDLLKDEEYFEFIRRRAGGKTETVDLTPREAEWIKQYDALGDKLAADTAERDDLMKIAADIRTPEQKKRLLAIRAETDKAAKAFETFLARAEEVFRAKGASEERLGDIRGSIDLQQTLNELPGRPAALYTLMTADGVRIIINIPGLRAPRQAKTKVPAAELNKKILAFREALTNPRLDPRPLGAELYDLLVRPIEKDLKGARVQNLMWSLDGTLRYIPLWALYDRETKQYLIEKYPSSLFTPHTVAGLLRAPRNWTGAEFGVTKASKVGDVAFTALPGVGEELAGVHRSLGGPEPKLDDAFTLDAFRDALDAQPGVVHVATHFHFKPGDEAGSILLLGKGQSLSVEALRDMSENALGGVDLLVLSACDTAMSGDADGKEFEGFALLAQYKGAGAVLATLWPVADESTALLMGEFYRLKKNHREWTKLEALRQAQLEMMHGHLGSGNASNARSSYLGKSTTVKSAAPPWPAGLPKYAHPYYWAPFVLTGNWK